MNGHGWGPWGGREAVVQTGWPEIVATLVIALLIVAWMVV